MQIIHLVLTVSEINTIFNSITTENITFDLYLVRYVVPKCVEKHLLHNVINGNTEYPAI